MIFKLPFHGKNESLGTKSYLHREKNEVIYKCKFGILTKNSFKMIISDNMNKLMFLVKYYNQNKQ